MEKYYWVLIALLGFLTIVLTALLCLVVYFLFFKRREASSSDTLPSEVKNIFKPTPPPKNLDIPVLSTCDIHTESRAVNVCAICGSQLCELCVRSDENIVFCPTHFKTYVDNHWIEISNIRTTPKSPEACAPVYDFKERLWKDEKTPTFIITHYKIDVESDQIESHVKLMVREEEKEELEKRLKEIIQ